MAGCIPLAVVIMTTADAMHPAVSGRNPKLLLMSDLYRLLTEIAEVHYTHFVYVKWWWCRCVCLIFCRVINTYSIVCPHNKLVGVYSCSCVCLSVFLSVCLFVYLFLAQNLYIDSNIWTIACFPCAKTSSTIQLELVMGTVSNFAQRFLRRVPKTSYYCHNNKTNTSVKNIHLHQWLHVHVYKFMKALYQECSRHNYISY